MSATVVLNNVSIPAGGSVTGIYTSTQPFRGVQVMMQQTMAAKCPRGCRVSYQLSIDGGSTYSDPISVGHEPNPYVTASVGHAGISLTESADHVLFTVSNSDSVACTSFTLQAETFS